MVGILRPVDLDAEGRPSSDASAAPRETRATVGRILSDVVALGLHGSSIAYSMFTGVIEAVGGALLFNRRTTTLGALVSLGALSQVVALNLSYYVLFGTRPLL
jgi:hypothetical protein